MPKQKKTGVRPPINGVVLPRRGPMVTYRNVGQRGVVDPVVSDTGSSTGPVYLSTDSTGTGTLSIVLAPKGLTGVNAAGTSNVSLSAPHLPWLRNTAANFLEYRVSRARLIIVGNVGSTTSGQVAVTTTTDMIDVFATPVPSFNDLTVGGMSFALADLANNNKSIPMRIDSTWKKVTSTTNQLISGTIINNSNADDLCFSGFIIRVNGLSSATNVLSTYVEYDVEFRGVASVTFNA